jgi:hypothetical protein
MMMRVRWWIAGLLVWLLVWLLGGALASEGQTLLFRLDDPKPQESASFGSALAAVGDVDGDGVPDLAVGAPGQEVAGRNSQGQVSVLSGATGSLLHTLDDPTPRAGASFGSALAAVGDVDGDGVPDLAVGAPGQNVYHREDQERVRGQGRAFLFSLGATP